VRHPGRENGVEAKGNRATALAEDFGCEKYGANSFMRSLAILRAAIRKLRSAAASTDEAGDGAGSGESV
jgi:hypothetical protein